MKITKQLTIILAAGLAFTACDKKPEGGATGTNNSGGGSAAPAVDEKTAIANFKTEMEGVSKWMEEKQKTVQAEAATNPAAGMAMMGEMVSKIKAVKTDGLPADFKAAWGEFTTVFGEMGDIFKGVNLSKDTKPEDMMKAMTEIGPKMQAIQAKVEPIQKKLTELGLKYGFDLDKMMKK